MLVAYHERVWQPICAHPQLEHSESIRGEATPPAQADENSIGFNVSRTAVERTQARQLASLPAGRPQAGRPDVGRRQSGRAERAAQAKTASQ